MNLKEGISGALIASLLGGTPVTGTAGQTDSLEALTPPATERRVNGVFQQLIFPAPGDALKVGDAGSTALAVAVEPDSSVSRLIVPHPELLVTAELRPRVDFWKSVFRTPETVEIFHNRAYPWIEYDRMDFSAAQDSLPPEQYEAFREKLVEEKSKEIFSALKRLSHGETPQNELELKLSRVFAGLPGGTELLNEAARSQRMVRSQRGMRDVFELALERTALYSEIVDGIICSYNLPEEISLLPVIESGYDVNAGSYKGARGMWQFMRSTARRYGLTVNRVLDERLDPVKATDAAARYLIDAYQALGSWPLAITSYNHGPYGIRRAIERVGSDRIEDIIAQADERGLRRFGFASANFYAELLAVRELAAERSLLVIQNGEPEPLRWQEFKLERNHTIQRICEILDVTPDEIRPLNPALKERVWSGRYAVPAGYVLRLPADTPREKLAELARDTEPYIVRPGDTLSRIAAVHRVSVRKLKTLNNLNDDLIYPGDKLIVRE